MSRHTPTPRLMPFCAHGRTEVLAWRVDFGDESVIWTEHESTARLIAAAPTMLAALKECREAISAGPLVAGSAYQTVLEAIAKAEGRE